MLLRRFYAWSNVWILLVFFLQACGAEYQTDHIRDYRIFVESSDTDMLETVEMLADQFNADYGEEVLRFTSDPESANSYIRFRSGLLSDEGKLGFGNWVATSTIEEEDIMPGKQQLKRTVVYAMDIEFDLENFQKRLVNRFDSQSNDWAHLYHLFCHEVGHGMQLDHSEIRNSVMYKSIAETSRPDVDYENFFVAARNSLKPVEVD